MCGIFAIFSSQKKKDIGYNILNGLRLLQHRGKDGYGIAFYIDNNFYIIKKTGKIKIDDLNIAPCQCCIGHNRYATSGKTIKNGIVKENELQPLKGEIDGKEYYLVHNGNIPYVQGHDTRYIINLINSLIGLSMEERLIYIINKIPAAYCLVLLFDNKLYIIRDKYGIRPLCIGCQRDCYYISSESYGLGNIPFLKDVLPGEILRIDENGLQSIYIHPNNKEAALCTFEILYFLNENSIVDGYNIKNIRQQLAIKLASKERNIDKKCIVIGIPLTGIILGKAYAKYLDLEYKQWIVKNAGLGRTFIIKTDKERKEACLKKFNYHSVDLIGKKIIIVDDTIVRGNIIRAIIQNLRNIGVKEVHVRIPAPPVIDKCYLGISIQDKCELIKTGRTIDEICKVIKADTLKYLTLNDIGEFMPKESYNHCFSGYIDKEINISKMI
ncbi:amidophosphoribosyltransferase [uncultured Mediterranean phage]|nr:amidophosphoribosyltransferase [uncultured Mediterranean phage]